MIVLQTRGLTLAFGERTVFSVVSLEIHHGERVGLVGANGGGKSSLLGLLSGRLTPTAGSVRWNPVNISFGYLPQMIGDGIHPVMVDPASLGDPALSGGEQVRRALAELFRQAPSVLLLDEPTNHLDIDGLEWLEAQLKRFPGTVLVASHDRFFLDAIATRTLEVEDGCVREFAGAYSEYAREKALEQERIRDQYDAYQKKRRQLEAVIQDKRQQAARASATKVKTGGDAPVAAKSFYAAKGKASVKVATALEQRLKRMEAPPLVVADTMVWKPQASVRGPRQLIRSEDLGFSYEPGRWLFRHATFVISRGDRVGIVGANGSGKSTLLRLIRGVAEPLEGTIATNPGMSMAILDQQGERYPDGKTLVDIVNAQAPGRESEVRSVLASLLFRGDRALQSAAKLSGGERVRLDLAKILVNPPDLLILDEPTNHLDLASRNIVEQALAGYGGTIVLVSHDRHLLNRVAKRLLVLADGAIEQIFDTYEGWRQRRPRGRRTDGANPSRPTDKNSFHAAEQRLLLEVQLARVSAELAHPSLGDETKERLNAEFFQIRRDLNQLAALPVAPSRKRR